MVLTDCMLPVLRDARHGIYGDKTALLRVQAMASQFTGWWTPTALSSMWLASDETGGNVTASGQAVGKWDDISGAGFSLLQATASDEPQYDLTGTVASLVFDGTDDEIGADTSLPADCSVFCVIKTSDTQGIMFNSEAGAGTRYIGVWDDGSTGEPNINSGSPVPTTHVDGAASNVGNRGDLEDAISDGAWHTVEVRGADLTDWPGFYVAGRTDGSGFKAAASYGDVLIVPTAVLDANPGLRDDILAVLRKRNPA